MTFNGSGLTVDLSVANLGEKESDSIIYRCKIPNFVDEIRHLLHSR